MSNSTGPNFDARALLQIIVGVFVVWLCIYGMLGAFAQNFDRETVNMLSGLTQSLFSALAFAGVIVAILMQNAGRASQDASSNDVSRGCPSTSSSDDRECTRL